MPKMTKAKKSALNRARACKNLKRVFDDNLRKSPLMSIKAMDRAFGVGCQWPNSKESSAKLDRIVAGSRKRRR